MKSAPVALFALLLLAAGCQTPDRSSAPGPSAAAPAAGPELAPAAFTPPTAGTIVVGQLEDGSIQKSRVVGTDGYAVTLRRGGERITRLPFCYSCGHPRDYTVEMERYEALWPLEVGKSVTFQRRRASDGAIWIHDVAVTGTETVETEFGPVDAYVVRQEVRGTGGNRWHGTRTQWYAPKLGWNVKSEWRSSDGESGSWKIGAIALANPG